MTASVCTQCAGNSSHRTRQFRELQRSCSMDAPQRPIFLGVPFYLCSPLLSPPSVCLSGALTNPLRLAEIHTSCLTARCHVYPGRSALCNLKPLLNVRPHLCAERQLLTEGRQERCERMNAARKRRVARGDKVAVCTGDLVALTLHLRLARRPRGLILPKRFSQERTILFTTASVIDWSTAVPNMYQASQMFGGSICLMYYRDSQQQQTHSRGQKSTKRCVSRRLGFISFHGLS